MILLLQTSFRRSCSFPTFWKFKRWSYSSLYESPRITFSLTHKVPRYQSDGHRFPLAAVYLLKSEDDVESGGVFSFSGSLNRFISEQFADLLEIKARAAACQKSFNLIEGVKKFSDCSALAKTISEISSL